MGNNDISEKLQNLARGKNRSATSRIREVLDDIEEALRAGVRREDVHKVLVESGIELTFASFELALYRIRRAEKGKQAANKFAQGPQMQIPVSPAATLGGNPLRVLSGKPREGEHSAIPLAKFEVDNT